MGDHHDPHGHGYTPPGDVDNIVLFFPPLLGLTIVVVVVSAVIWF